MDEINSIKEIVKILESDEDFDMKENKLLSAMINLQELVCQWTKKNIENRLKIIAELRSDNLTEAERHDLCRKSENLLVKTNAGEAVARLIQREKTINQKDKNGN
jgi:hypothetical protein